MGTLTVTLELLLCERGRGALESSELLLHAWRDLDGALQTEDLVQERVQRLDLGWEFNPENLQLPILMQS
jgi:hypothetical protein